MFKFFTAAMLLSFSAQAALVISSPAATTTPITIKTCDHDAGAICSLTWKGKQFINDYDHGRQLQSAVSFDGLGEAYNPTEAGCETPHNYFLHLRYNCNQRNPSPSSSVLLAHAATTSQLETYSQMAFWKPVGASKLSNHKLRKIVTIGYEGMANVIEYKVEFTMPLNEQHSFAQFEVLTAYMPYEFSRFRWYRHPDSISEYGTNGFERNMPVIASTNDGSHAIGFFNPATPQINYPDAGYGSWKFETDKVMKINNVMRFSNPLQMADSQGTVKFRVFVIVGTFAEVKEGMNKLHTMFNRNLCLAL